MSFWLFDAYPSPGGMTLWALDADARAHCFTDTLTASFFIHGTPRQLHVVCQYVAAAGLPVTMRRTERRDLFQRRELELLELVVPDPARFPGLVRNLSAQFPDLTLYNADVALEQIYFFERNLFPLARIELEADSAGRVRAIANADSPWTLDYALPPFTTMILKLEGAPVNPNHDAQPRPLEVTVEDTTRVLCADDPREMLLRLRALLLQYDPDLILTAWGDSFILPRLLELAHRYGVSLPLNRDPARPILARPARSYFSYGRIVYKTASHLLAGRWHIDFDNAHLLDDYALDGVFELARLSQLPVQRAARVSTGTCVSAMELATAYRERILIPVVKNESEEMKSAAELVTSDKGGLVFQPIAGLHEQVAELDFTSMFPTIMARFNISAETLNCPCCPSHLVPELGYHICQQHRGLIPTTIAPLIAKRTLYKRGAKTAADPVRREQYRRRASCLKWALVTVFGYTGYRNARFGQIQAHEAINAYGRDALLTAKEIAEARGFRMIHAIVDALYLRKPDATDRDYQSLIQAISNTTRLPIELEGIYHWIAFLPSRQDPLLPVANRYFGVMRDGELKVRGIEARRSDTPPFIRDAQTALLHILAQATNRAEFRARMAEALQLAGDYLDTLRAGQVPFYRLAVTQRLSREPRAYRTHHLNALVARQLLDGGVELAPGERIQYVILDNAARIPTDRARPLEHLDGSLGYDADRYSEFLIRSVATLFSCIGFSQPALEQHFAIRRALPQPDRPRLPPPATDLPLFAWAAKNSPAGKNIEARSQTLP